MITVELDNFSLKEICQSGQCFRMRETEKNTFELIAGDKYLKITQEGTIVNFHCSDVEFLCYWVLYFDLDADYEKYIDAINPRDSYLVQAAEAGRGIRILRQDLWEMIITFLISQQNNITRIRGCVERLCQHYGKHLKAEDGTEYYAFPTPEQLSKASQEQIRACQTGFRDKYIKSTTDSVILNNKNISEYTKLNTEECLKELLKFNGVGPKVGDCIALFGMQKYDTFPVDVWVKRVMQEFYVEEDLSLPKIRAYAIDKFKELSGFAQQYLFYYARELGIGR